MGSGSPYGRHCPQLPLPVQSLSTVTAKKVSLDVNAQKPVYHVLIFVDANVRSNIVIVNDCRFQVQNTLVSMNIPCLELIKFCLVVTYSITIEEFMRMTLEKLKDSSEMSVTS